ncbi:hypothetical protein [Pectobacterium aroidearum]|uniref:hypothetical protein n=1 Tax=Pectobacterium aroidearum TaxID=1201031 RepID=UPI0032EF9B60
MDNWFSLISPGLAIIGWGIAYRLAKVNSTRTESKSLIDSCNTILDTTAEKGCDFYLLVDTNNSQKMIFEKYAISKITLLHNKLDLLEKRGIEIEKNMISELHESLTLGIPLQGKNKADDDKSSHLIIKNSSSISYRLHSEFYLKYPPIENLFSLRRYLK